MTTDEITLRCPRCGLEADAPSDLSRFTVRDGHWARCVCGECGVIACPALNDAYQVIAQKILS